MVNLSLPLKLLYFCGFFLFNVFNVTCPNGYEGQYSPSNTTYQMISVSFYIWSHCSLLMAVITMGFLYSTQQKWFHTNLGWGKGTFTLRLCEFIFLIQRKQVWRGCRGNSEKILSYRESQQLFLVLGKCNKMSISHGFRPAVHSTIRISAAITAHLIGKDHCCP